VVHEALAVCMSILFSVYICEAREVHVVHEALAVADGVEDVQGGGLGDVLLVEMEVQKVAEVVRVHEVPEGSRCRRASG